VEKIKKFEDLVAWQEAHALTLLIYHITDTFPSAEKYNLTSQLRRAVVSIESCGAEGFSRFHYKERLQFYYDARGSLGEVQSQMIDARDLKFVGLADYKSVVIQAQKTEVVLAGLIRSTRGLLSRK
jgi:four helix bundle protein